MPWTDGHSITRHSDKHTLTARGHVASAMSLDCERKPEFLEETHTDTGRAQKLSQREGARRLPERHTKRKSSKQ